MHMPKKIIALVIAAMAIVGTASAAHAAPRPSIDLRGDGLGSVVVDAAGTAALSGNVTGRPFDGAYTATLAAADGSLPEPGVCEAATVTLDVTGSRNRYVQLAATGEVCGQWPNATQIVTHRFVGRYVVTNTSERKLRGTDGWISTILVTEGRANVEVIDT